MDDDIVDFVSLSDAELKALIGELTAEEQELSRRRRILHGRIDILRAELVARLQGQSEQGHSVITADDVRRLSEILAGKHSDRLREELEDAEPGEQDEA